MITNDAVIMGLLAVILGAVFITESSKNPFWKNSIPSFQVFCCVTFYRRYSIRLV